MSKFSTFILTYVWLIFIVLVVILFLSTSHVLKPDYTCELENNIFCKNVILSQNSLLMTLQNEMANTTRINNIQIKGDGIDCSTGAVDLAEQESREISLQCTYTEQKFFDTEITMNTDSGTIHGRLTIKY